MPSLVEEVLGTWRERERLLGDLEPLDPDRETVQLSIATLRQLYADLTDRREGTKARIRTGEATYAGANAVIRAARERLDRSEASG